MTGNDNKGRGGKQGGRGGQSKGKVIEVRRQSTGGHGGVKKSGGGGGVQKTAGGHRGRGGRGGRGGPRRGGSGGRGGRRSDRAPKKTKEDLDAEMDQYMLGDKKMAPKILDDDLDDYWKNKPAAAEEAEAEAAAPADDAATEEAPAE